MPNMRNSKFRRKFDENRIIILENLSDISSKVSQIFQDIFRYKILVQYEGRKG